MEILFCGTAAAEGWPGLFCTCAVCREARTRGGKDLRTRSAYMLGDRVRIDFGPDANLHHHKYNLAYENLEHLLVTHSHDDHWFPKDLAHRRAGFSVAPETPLHLWGNARVEQAFCADNSPDWDQYRIVFHRLVAWEPIALGEGLVATPILAMHDPAEECVNYRLEANGRAALLGHDTGWYDPRAFEFLSGTPLDVLVLDCTWGTIDHEFRHMGGLALVRLRDELARRGALKSDARCIATHFSHNGGALHEDLERFFAPHGFEVAYDGLRVIL